MARSLLFALSFSALLLTACPAKQGPSPKPATPVTKTPPKKTPDTKTPAPGAKKAAGAPCAFGHECESGACDGKGCDALGKCAPKGRMCTTDLRMYCGCDNKTFQGSGSCPKHRYRHRGPCKAPLKVNP